MYRGYIKLWRKFKDWEWASDCKTSHLFIHLLIMANHEEGNWHGQIIQPGQLITGRFILAKETGLSQQSIRTCLERLKSTNEITIKPTNKFSLITLLNWPQYQSEEKKSTSKSTKKLTNNQPTTNQQLTTNKNVEECKNDKNISISHSEHSSQVNDIIKIFYEINPTINWANKTLRSSAERLITKLGVEKAIEASRGAVAVFGKPYAPTITTPAQLESKLADLVSYYKKNSNQSNVISI